MNLASGASETPRGGPAGKVCLRLAAQGGWTPARLGVQGGNGKESCRWGVRSGQDEKEGYSRTPEEDPGPKGLVRSSGVLALS